MRDCAAASAPDGDSSPAGWRASEKMNWQRRFVWIVWAVATSLAVLSTAVYGKWLPWSDDFDVLPYVTGDKPVSLAWLWRQHNEHRIPLVKLLFVAIGRASGCDYRWTLVVNALLLSATAAALIVAARRLRGWTAWTDALFPAVLLHLGQGAMAWAFHLQFTLTTVLAGLLVATAVAAPGDVVWRSAAMAACTCLLPLTGAGGLVMAVAAAALLAVAAFRPDATGGHGAGVLARSFAAAGAGLAIAATLLSLATLHLIPANGYASPWQTLIGSLDALASYPGGLVARFPTVWRLATAVAVAVTVAAAMAALRRDGAADRWSIAILLGYIAALGIVGVAIGYGRGARDFTHLYGHYSTLALGVPVALALVWARLPQGPFARTFQALLCCVALVVAVNQARRSIRYWGSAAEASASIASDMRGSLPPDEVAARHAGALYFLDEPEPRRKIADAVAMLRRTRFPLYCSRPAAP